MAKELAVVWSLVRERSVGRLGVNVYTLPVAGEVAERCREGPATKKYMRLLPWLGGLSSACRIACPPLCCKALPKAFASPA
jgi:hypothetical protein